MRTRGYWFFLKSHVYVEFKKEKILLYNTKNGNYIEAVFKEVISLVMQMYEPKNLGVIFLSKEQKSNAIVHDFVQEVLEKQIGELLDVRDDFQKPIQLIPILNLQRDVDRLKKTKTDSVLLGRDILNYLIELNIYLNDSCSKNCILCKDYYKQIHCCTAKNIKQELSNKDLENIFRQVKYSAVRKINILGGNIFNINKLNAKMLQLSDLYKNILHIYLYYDNYRKNEFMDSLNLELIVNFPVNEIVFKNVSSIINEKMTTFHFIIENEEQYYKMEKLISQFNIKKYDVQPFFNGKNLDFFREYIFLNKNDIFHKVFHIREIFRNQKLNSNFFGSMYILPDGTVKANMNAQSLGNIREDALLDLIYKEMLENTSWRKVRDQQPCSGCVYQYLCPPLSNYELTIGKINLCHIKP